MNVTLPRKLFLAFSIGLILVMAYYMLYHEPCQEKISRLKQEKTVLQDSGIRKGINNDQRLRQSHDLDGEIAKLRNNIQQIESGLECTTHELRNAIILFVEHLSGIPGLLSFNAEPACDIARTYSKDDTLTFKITSNFDGIRKFFERMPSLKGMPLSWYLEADEEGELMNLWMEIAP